MPVRPIYTLFFLGFLGFPGISAQEREELDQRENPHSWELHEQPTMQNIPWAPFSVDTPSRLSSLGQPVSIADFERDFQLYSQQLEALLQQGQILTDESLGIAHRISAQRRLEILHWEQLQLRHEQREVLQKLRLLQDIPGTQQPGTLEAREHRLLLEHLEDSERRLAEVKEQIQRFQSLSSKDNFSPFAPLLLPSASSIKAP